MEKIFCGRRTRAAENHWQEVDADGYKITKPTFLIFGGNLTTHPEQANSYAKIIYKLLDKFELDASGVNIFEDFDCLSFYYKQNLLMCTYNRRALGQMLNYSIVNEVDELYAKMVRPLVQQEIALAKSGQEQYFHPLANLILFAHSAGSQIAFRLQELIHDDLLQQLEEETCLKILKNVKYYGFASYVKVPCFDQTYVVGSKDVTMMEYYPAISFSVERGSDSAAFNYYSCESPLFERQQHQTTVGVTDIVELYSLDNANLTEKFGATVAELKSKIILEPSKLWTETMVDETTFEIKSVKFANLKNDDEKVILADVGHGLVHIVEEDEKSSSTGNHIEDMFVHSTPKYVFERQRLDLSNLKNLAYITLSDDLTETLKHKCELNKTADNIIENGDSKSI